MGESHTARSHGTDFKTSLFFFLNEDVPESPARMRPMMSCIPLTGVRSCRKDFDVVVVKLDPVSTGAAAAAATATADGSLTVAVDD